MSDTKECCVCYEATEHMTPCNHLVYESCYSRVKNTCPTCRASLENGGGFSDDELNLRMTMAAEAGDKRLVRQMLSQGANAYNTGLTSAAAGGNESIVRLMLGATNYSHATSIAAFYGHESIVRLLLDHGASDYNMALRRAALKGHENIVELIQERMNPA